MHYKDGMEAKVGDLVKGTAYNTKGTVVGVMLGITPGSETCNCRMGVLQRREVGELILFGDYASGTPYLLEARTHDGSFLVHREGSGADASASMVGVKIDYSQCSHLELVHRAESAPAESTSIEHHRV